MAPKSASKAEKKKDTAIDVEPPVLSIAALSSARSMKRARDAARAHFQPLVDEINAKAAKIVEEHLPKNLARLEALLHDKDGPVKLPLAQVRQAAIDSLPPVDALIGGTVSGPAPNGVPSVADAGHSSDSDSGDSSSAVEHPEPARATKKRRVGKAGKSQASKVSAPAPRQRGRKTTLASKASASASSSAAASRPDAPTLYSHNAAHSGDELARLRARVPCNVAVVALVDTCKVECIEYVEHLAALKVWIQLNIPKMEDGHNFGVGVQEEVIGELQRADDSAFETLELTTKYFVSRGRLVSKVLKHPHVVDFREAIKEYDEKQFTEFRQALVELRNNYALTYDLISKNWEKITKPRSDTHEHNPMAMY